MVGKNKLATPGSQDFEMFRANQILKLLEFGLEGHKIRALRVEGKPLESSVVNKDVRSAGCIRAIFHIEISPIQDQDVALYIKRYGRQSPEILVQDQLALRRLQQRLGKWAGRQNGIEYDHRRPPGREE